MPNPTDAGAALSHESSLHHQLPHKTSTENQIALPSCAQGCLNSIILTQERTFHLTNRLLSPHSNYFFHVTAQSPQSLFFLRMTHIM